MLIKDAAINIPKQVDLTREQTQLLVEFEVLLIGLGLTYTLRCIPCAQAKHPDMYPQGSMVHDSATGAARFSIRCGCRHMSYAGNDIVSPLPPAAPRVDAPLQEEKPERLLTRDDMAFFSNIETLLSRLKLQYELRCIACRVHDRNRGIVWGSQETTGHEWRAECACTNRIYRGSDAVAKPH